jgi:creatinine amidohydrolase
MWWQELKWPTIEAIDKRLPVIIPLGSIEQHGRHLPVGVDTLQVQAIADEAERALKSSALFLPTLWLGCSDHHRDFPGTLTAQSSLYTQIIKSIVRSTLAAGFNRIFLLNGHGGNEVPAAAALGELSSEDNRADAAALALASWWQVARDSIRPEAIGMQSPGISHACEYETSLMLLLRPDLVSMSDAVDIPPAIDNPWINTSDGGPVQLFKRYHRLTESGNFGRPTIATVKKGDALFAAVTKSIITFIQEFAQLPDQHIRRKSTGTV